MARQTSAWAALFYFASRVAEPGGPARPLITWPEGNGRLVGHLARGLGAALRPDTVAVRVSPGARGAEVAALRGGQQAVGWRAEQVIMACPRFVARHVVRGLDDASPGAMATPEHGAWVVANLALRARPRERGFPLAWDNVLYESPSLGYVNAAHQTEADRGPALFTYYYPIVDDAPGARGALLQLSQPEWAESILADLRRAHPDLPALVDSLDVMLWGHAMVRPRPGAIWGGVRQRAARPFRAVHFAHSELSGVALFEEALAQGIRAATEVLALRGRAPAAW